MMMHMQQPVHHWLWTFIALDNSTQGACAARGQYWLRQAMVRLHSPGADMYCGDEDNGEVSPSPRINSGVRCLCCPA